MKRQDKAKSILYYPVADVDTDDLRKVFRVAQHLDLSPEEHAIVQWIQPSRSMMVGDVVINCHGAFRLEPSGFKRI